MTNKIVLIKNRSYRNASSGQQDLLDNSLKRVCGAKIFSGVALPKELDASDLGDCVFVIPILIPEFQQDVLEILKALERRQPLPAIVAVQFLLIPEADAFHPDSLLEPFWIDTLDRFYDQAIPTSFVALYQDVAQVQLFQVSAAVSGLFRDVDNIGELRRINATLEELEQRLGALEIHPWTNPL